MGGYDALLTSKYKEVQYLLPYVVAWTLKYNLFNASPKVVKQLLSVAPNAL